MYWVDLAAVFGVVGVISVIIGLLMRYDGDTFLGFGGFMMIIMVLIIGLGVGRSLFASSSQRYDNENLVKISQFQEIYQKRAEALTAQFVHYLAEVYPQHEKDIFDKIKPENIDVYLAKYPEVKSSETIIQLATQIKSLQDDYYSQQLERATTLLDMRYRPKSPWIFQRVMPKDIEIPTE